MSPCSDQGLPQDDQHSPTRPTILSLPSRQSEEEPSCGDPFPLPPAAPLDSTALSLPAVPVARPLYSEASSLPRTLESYFSAMPAPFPSGCGEQPQPPFQHSSPPSQTRSLQTPCPDPVKPNAPASTVSSFSSNFFFTSSQSSTILPRLSDSVTNEPSVWGSTLYPGSLTRHALPGELHPGQPRHVGSANKGAAVRGSSHQSLNQLDTEGSDWNRPSAVEAKGRAAPMLGVASLSLDE
ncbi:unnamed protein product [Protopolystoma xenopodis]|uniref:Uncharacterized protein n=1 Tax=Protopolystoma xenopodis TaxID=117903 RepID=A0A3S5AFD9_9PLAT|nr:unnamed protein product [Protopolystoma xenopodis]